MAKGTAWDIIHTVVGPRLKEVGIKIEFPYGTIMSVLDWDNGVAMHTPKGTVHVLGDGRIVDTDDVLKLK